MMQDLLQTLRHWPLDKQLTLLFPIIVLAIALLSGSILAIEPMENKAALFAGLLFLLLILVIPPLLQRHIVSSNTAWFLREFWPVPAILLGYLTMRVFRLELAVDFFQIPLG
ncbi:hypothetical protein [Kistimonas asteriae]|uniref:hypothetical protein n=1 Tax=Kistimonas asteriae TaxID=517724 RepID=UPI001BAD7617|nr:hypothetical protein [Kistimonas asteriae]